MAEQRTEEITRGLRAYSIGRVPKRRGDLLDGMSPQERAEIRRVLVIGEGSGIPAEKRGVCYEEEGKHSEAGHEFISASRQLGRKNPKMALGLLERALRNFALAGDKFHATFPAYRHLGEVPLNESEALARRLVGFCRNEARGRVEAGDPHGAASLLGIASCLMSPFSNAESDRLRRESEWVREGNTGSQPKHGLSSPEDC